MNPHPYPNKLVFSASHFCGGGCHVPCSIRKLNLHHFWIHFFFIAKHPKSVMNSPPQLQHPSRAHHGAGRLQKVVFSSFFARGRLSSRSNKLGIPRAKAPGRRSIPPNCVPVPQQSFEPPVPVPPLKSLTLAHPPHFTLEHIPPQTANHHD